MPGGGVEASLAFVSGDGIGEKIMVLIFLLRICAPRPGPYIAKSGVVGANDCLELGHIVSLRCRGVQSSEVLVTMSVIRTMLIVSCQPFLSCQSLISFIIPCLPFKSAPQLVKCLRHLADTQD